VAEARSPMHYEMKMVMITQQSTSQSQVPDRQSLVYRLKSTVSSPPRRQAAAGFTLLELMTVIVIMFILMGMSTLALRGIMRGAGISGAVSNVRSMLTQARQQAIMNQQATAVVFTQSGSTNTMQILTSYGRVSDALGTSGFTAEDRLPWDHSEIGAVDVYNFRGGSGGFSGAGTNETYGTSNITWQVDDDIAFQVGAIRPLPVGIEFGGLPSPPIVVFNPDGSARAELSIELLEQNAANAAGFIIHVDPQTGWIEVEEPAVPDP
jgi:type II secretory pathway pseudopilin PulG